MTGGPFSVKWQEMEMEQSLPALCFTEEKTEGLESRKQNVRTQHFCMITP